MGSPFCIYTPNLEWRKRIDTKANPRQHITHTRNTRNTHSHECGRQRREKTDIVSKIGILRIFSQKNVCNCDLFVYFCL
jgi:hypothetical protein